VGVELLLLLLLLLLLPILLLLLLLLLSLPLCPTLSPSPLRSTPPGCLVSIGFAKPLHGTGGYARYVAICPAWQ
jgi:hypothetical protein